MADTVLLLAALPFLLFSAWSDLRFMRIWNRANLGFVLVFVVLAPFLLPLGEVGMRLAIGAGVAVLLALVWLSGHFGGGDAKYLAALAPWVAPADWPAFCMILSACLMLLLAMLALARRWAWLRAQTPEWRAWRKRRIPLGVGISGAGLLYLASRALNSPVVPG